MRAPLKQYTWGPLKQYPGPRGPHLNSTRTHMNSTPGPTWGQSERERSKSWSVSIVLNYDYGQQQCDEHGHQHPLQLQI